MVGESIDDFINAESLGNTYKLANKNDKLDISIKEKREMELIENGLTFKDHYWEARYPWVRSPYYLPNNRETAIAILKSTEKRLMKDEDHMRNYKLQIQDMLERKVARKLSAQEIRDHDGPVYYITHHEVLKPKSVSTPYRIVFNASSNFKGHILNDYWAKGPTLMNNLAGILVRFRENFIGVVGDVQKMYHTIKLSPQDQHTHRFLWRECEANREPDDYVMTSVSFGDRPAGTIAILALRKTADMGGEQYTRSKSTIKDNSFVDDLIDSFSNLAESKMITSEIDSILSVGGFKIKEWIFSGEDNCDYVVDESGHYSHLDQDDNSTNTRMLISQKVLGIYWTPKIDEFCFTVKLNFSPKRRGVKVGPDLTLSDIKKGIPMPLTRRIILSCINGLYDPIGLIAPFIIRAKILLRELWSMRSEALGWDDPIPGNMQDKWHELFIDMFDLNHVSFKRCIKPADATANDPILLMFCDSSEVAFGSCAYVHWKLVDGKYKTNLLMAKTHVAPITMLSIVKLEVNAARLGSRLKTFIDSECRLVFSRVYMITESEITLAMIQKDSYKFKTYFGVRINEIQERTNTGDWYWTSSENNIADWLSRGKHPIELKRGSDWQNGPSYLQECESCWPFKQTHSILVIPEVIKAVMKLDAQVNDSLCVRIKIDRYSSYIKLIRVTCRIISCYRKSPNFSFHNIVNKPKSTDYISAINMWVANAQSSIKDFEKQYVKLGPVKTGDNKIYMVGKRVEKWMQHSYNEVGLPLLPASHRFSFLYATYIHEIGHFGVMTTVARIRLRFWITKANRLVTKIVKNCIICKRNRKELEQQAMGQLPRERLNPSPPFYNVALDYFGPLAIKGEVNSRTRGKGYGVIFTCLYTRAVFVDLANNASTDSFLIVLRKFTSIRGYPAKFFSDNGSHFRKASKELIDILKKVDWQISCDFGAEAGVEWHFSSADAPWQNGCVESLIKPVKKAIQQSVGAHILKFSELQAVMYEAANLVNERPVGKHPTSPEEGSYLSPNDMLLGRATSRVPSGPFREVSNRHRFELVQSIADMFWKKWNRNYFSSLIIRNKWHAQKRNVKVDDIVIVKDIHAIRGNWRIGRIYKIYPSADGCVRRVQLSYKQTRPGMVIPQKFTNIDRPVQDLIVIVPNEEA